MAIALREILRVRGNWQSLWAPARASKDPTVFTVLGEHSAALAGLLVTFPGVFLGHRLGLPELDGAASIVIGVTLILVASFLALESRALIVGECASPAVVGGVREVLNADAALERLARLLTMHLGPRNALVATEVRFDPALTVPEVEAAMDRIEQDIRETQPYVGQIFIEG